MLIEKAGGRITTPTGAKWDVFHPDFLLLMAFYMIEYWIWQMKETIDNQETIMRAKGHSLWLMPEGEAYDKLSQLIKRLVKEYNTPVFEPHVTLLDDAMQPEEDILRRAEQLVAGQRPFPATLKIVDYQDFYFQALFVRAEETEPLFMLHNRAREAFEMQGAPSPPYMPHLSLLYGNFPQEVKERIIEAIGRDQTTQFIVDRIHIFKTDGEVNTWHKVGEFPLAELK